MTNIPGQGGRTRFWGEIIHPSRSLPGRQGESESCGLAGTRRASAGQSGALGFVLGGGTDEAASDAQLGRDSCNLAQADAERNNCCAKIAPVPAHWLPAVQRSRAAIVLSNPK